VNRKVLSLEAAGQLHVPETDYSPEFIRLSHRSLPFQYAAPLLHWLLALWGGRSGQRSSAFGSAVLSAALIQVTVGLSSRDTRPSNADPHIWHPLARLIPGRLPTGLPPVQNKIAARAGHQIGKWTS
jgi:hypothetical protein